MKKIRVIMIIIFVFFSSCIPIIATEDNSNNTEYENIKENITPLAAPEVIGKWSILNLVATVLVVIEWVYYTVDKTKNQLHDLLDLFVLLLAILSIGIFVVTEDITLAMTIFDKWTIVMVILLLMQTILLTRGLKNKWHFHWQAPLKNKTSH